MKDTLTQGNEQRLAGIRSRLEKSNVMDVSFYGPDGDRALEYMDNVLDVLEENQAWLDENARKKAAKYQ